MFFETLPLLFHLAILCRMGINKLNNFFGINHDINNDVDNSSKDNNYDFVWEKKQHLQPNHL